MSNCGGSMNFTSLSPRTVTCLWWSKITLQNTRRLRGQIPVSWNCFLAIHAVAVRQEVLQVMSWHRLPTELQSCRCWQLCPCLNCFPDPLAVKCQILNYFKHFFHDVGSSGYLSMKLWPCLCLAFIASNLSLTRFEDHVVVSASTGRVCSSTHVRIAAAVDREQNCAAIRVTFSHTELVWHGTTSACMPFWAHDSSGYLDIHETLHNITWKVMLLDCLRSEIDLVDQQTGFSADEEDQQ